MLEITTFSDTRVSASVQVPADQTLLFTSIPYDEGWSLRVDGKETPKIRLLGALTGVELAEGRLIRLNFPIPQRAGGRGLGLTGDLAGDGGWAVEAGP